MSGQDHSRPRYSRRAPGLAPARDRATIFSHPECTPIFGCMAVFDIYSRRKRRTEQGEPDVYQYDHVPQPLRIQVRHILDQALGSWVEPTPRSYGTRAPRRVGHNEFLTSIHLQLLKEKAALQRLSTAGSRWISPKEDILEAITSDFPDVGDWLDVVEFCFWAIGRFLAKLRKEERQARGIEQDPDAAIEELNIRFRQAGLGYQFEAGKIVRVDSQYVHSEVMKPALLLLSDPRFAGAQQEFLDAHAHYRAGEYEDAILDANRAFESTMKTICDNIKGCEYPKGSRASDLVRIIRRNGLLPDYLDPSFEQLIATLQSGLPKVRNEVGGHGQGATRRETPGYIAGYALHLAAAKILLLVEAWKATR